MVPGLWRMQGAALRPVALLCLLLSAPAWAEPPGEIKVSSGYVTDLKGIDHTVGRSLLLPEELAIVRAQETADLRAEVVSLKAAPAPPPPRGAKDAAVLGTVLAVVAAVAFALGRLSK